MNELPRGFGYGDLPPADEVTPAEAATSLRIGRDLEAYAATERVEPSADFMARVMDAVATEPAPQPAMALGGAFRAGRPMALVAAFRDAWRVAFSGGRPAFVRAQALGLVLRGRARAWDGGWGGHRRCAGPAELRRRPLAFARLADAVPERGAHGSGAERLAGAVTDASRDGGTHGDGGTHRDGRADRIRRPRDARRDAEAR